MKNFHGFVFIVLSFVLFSCSKANTSDVEYSTALDLSEEFLQIGNLHNEGVDYAYREIRSHYSETKDNGSEVLSKNELLEIALAALYDYCGNVLPLPYDTRTTDDVNGNQTIDAEIEVYFERIKTFFAENPEMSSSELIDELNAVNNMALVQLSDTSKIHAVFSGTATCYSSYNYWKENHKKWIIALNYPELLDEYTDEELNALVPGEYGFVLPWTKSKISELWQKVKDTVSDWWNNGGKEIVYADGKGAAIGAMAGAMVGGAGAGPGAVAGGASASISEAIDQWKK